MSMKIAAASITIRTFMTNAANVAEPQAKTETPQKTEVPQKSESPQGGAAPTTQSSSTSVGLPSVASAEKMRVQGRQGHSIGDPHVRTGDGLDFDNMREGKFIKARSESGDFEVQTQQTKPDPNKNVTVNTAAAVKAGKDVVNYNAATNQLTVNGEAKTLNPGESLDLPDGGKVARNGENYTVTTTQGDTVEMKNQGGYLDVYTNVGENRASGEVRGELGNFDADTDTSNDLLGRDGQQLDTEKFLDDWTVKDGESLFNEDKAGAEAKGGAAPQATDGAQTAQNAQNAEMERAMKSFLEGLSPNDREMFGNFMKAMMGAFGQNADNAEAQPANQAAPAQQAAEQPQGGAAPAQAAAQPEEKKEEESTPDFMQFFQMLMKFFQMFQAQMGQTAGADAQKAA